VGERVGHAELDEWQGGRGSLMFMARDGFVPRF
jgi:hypothetical protein